MINKVFKIILVLVISIFIYWNYQQDGLTGTDGKEAGMDKIPVSPGEPTVFQPVKEASKQEQLYSFDRNASIPPIPEKMTHIRKKADVTYIIDPITGKIYKALPVIKKNNSNGLEILQIPNPLSDKPSVVVRKEGLSEKQEVGLVYAVNPITGIREELKPLDLSNSGTGLLNEIPSPLTD